MVKECPVAECLAMCALSPAPVSCDGGARYPRRATHTERAALLREGRMAWFRHRRGASQDTRVLRGGGGLSHQTRNRIMSVLGLAEPL